MWISSFKELHHKVQNNIIWGTKNLQFIANPQMAIYNGDKVEPQNFFCKCQWSNTITKALSLKYLQYTHWSQQIHVSVSVLGYCKHIIIH